MNSKRQGDIAEVLTQAACLEKGWTVLTPIGDNERYDLVIDRGNGFEKVQVKSCSSKGDKIVAYTRRVHNSRTKSITLNYTTDEIDVIVLYCRDKKQLYFIDVVDFANSDGIIPTQITLRLNPPSNNQVKGVKMAQDYQLDVPIV